MLLKKINNDANTRFFSLLALTLVILPRRVERVEKMYIVKHNGSTGPKKKVLTNSI